MKQSLDPKAARQVIGATAIAPVALFVYFVSEWLFLATGATTLAVQPVGVRLRALVEAPLPLLGALLAVQLVASIVSLAHRNLRGLSVLPSAIVLGLLALMLIDNFTYTVFGFGIVKAGPIARIPYAAGLLLLITLAAVKLTRLTAALARWPLPLIATLAVVLLLPAAIPAAARRGHRIDAAHATAGARPDARTEDVRPNILLLGSDGLEARVLSAYGYARPTTPFLEELRRESLVFENAFSNVGTTRGSMVTLLTGRLPTKTKVAFPPSSVRTEEASWHLPGILKSLGYATFQVGLRYQADAEDANLLGAFDAANYRWESLLSSDMAIRGEGDRLRATVLERAESRVLHSFGFRQMDDAYEFTIGRGDDPDLRDSVRVETLLRYIDEAPEPWLVHLHMVDTHCCAPKADRIFFPAGGSDAARDNAVRNADERFRAIVDALRRNGRLDRTIVVVSSDHGYSWETTERVPLMIRFPGARPAGVVEANAQLADVAPTLLDYLALPRPSWMDGMSLLRSAPPPDRPIFGLANDEPQRGIAGGWKPSDAGPPNFGANVGSMVVADRWYAVHFESGIMTSGRVEGHTRPGMQPLPAPRARDLLVGHFAAAQFAVAGASLPGSGQPPARGRAK